MIWLCFGLLATVLGVAGWVASRLMFDDSILDGFGDDFDEDLDETELWWLTDMEWRE